MRNTGLEEAQAGIKIAGRNINNLRYADDTSLTAESEEKLKSLLMKVKEESEKAGSKLNIQKMNVQFSHLPVSNSLRSHGLKHARLSCPSPTPGALLISWLQSPSAVILEPPKIKADTVSTASPSISMK